MDWNTKNVMPLLAAEKVVITPQVLAIVENRRMADFLQDVGGTWSMIDSLSNYTVLQKNNILILDVLIRLGIECTWIGINLVYVRHVRHIHIGELSVCVQRYEFEIK
nr:hypothetical protein [Veillonella criceti]